MFSFAGDTILDPFAGTGSTCIAAMRAGRSSLGFDIDPDYIDMARERCAEAATTVLVEGRTQPVLLP
jgi:site-specific DNA-methyltransferase (adenine-specific)